MSNQSYGGARPDEQWPFGAGAGGCSCCNCLQRANGCLFAGATGSGNSMTGAGGGNTGNIQSATHIGGGGMGGHGHYYVDYSNTGNGGGGRSHAIRTA